MRSKVNNFELGILDLRPTQNEIHRISRMIPTKQLHISKQSKGEYNQNPSREIFLKYLLPNFTDEIRNEMTEHCVESLERFARKFNLRPTEVRKYLISKFKGTYENFRILDRNYIYLHIAFDSPMPIPINMYGRVKLILKKKGVDVHSELLMPVPNATSHFVSSNREKKQ